MQHCRPGNVTAPVRGPLSQPLASSRPPIPNEAMGVDWNPRVRATADASRGASREDGGAHGRPDRELQQLGRARLPVVDELGFPPLDADGARLLFQVISQAYESQSVVFMTHLEFSR